MERSVDRCHSTYIVIRKRVSPPRCVCKVVSHTIHLDNDYRTEDWVDSRSYLCLIVLRLIALCRRFCNSCFIVRFLQTLLYSVLALRMASADSAEFKFDELFADKAKNSNGSCRVCNNRIRRGCTRIGKLLWTYFRKEYNVKPFLRHYHPRMFRLLCASQCMFIRTQSASGPSLSRVWRRCRAMCRRPCEPSRVCRHCRSTERRRII